MTEQQHEYDIGDAVKVRKGVDDPEIEYVNSQGGWGPGFRRHDLVSTPDQFGALPTSRAFCE